MNQPLLPTSLRRALERIDNLIDDADAVRLDKPDSLLAHYLQHCRDELLFSPQSLRQQYYYLRYVQRWFLGRGLPFPSGTTSDLVMAFLAFQRDHRGNSLVQQRHYLDTLRRFFALLLRDGLLAADPAAGIALKTPKICNVHQILSLRELVGLIDAARRDRDEAHAHHRFSRTRDAALTGLLITTGCRHTEALSLTRARIDLHAGVVFFPGKGDRRHAIKERVVPLEDSDVRDDLRRWLDLRPEAPDTPIFVTPSDRLVEQRSVLQRLRRLARLAGISRKVTPHSLRATFASRLVDNGIDPVALQQLMGHARLSTTLRRSQEPQIRADRPFLAESALAESRTYVLEIARFGGRRPFWSCPR